jgi:hypothetical protein
MAERTSPLAGEECFRCEHGPDPYFARVYRVPTATGGFLWFFLCEDCAGDVDAIEGESMLDVLLDYAGQASRWPVGAPELSYERKEDGP